MALDPMMLAAMQAGMQGGVPPQLPNAGALSPVEEAIEEEQQPEEEAPIIPMGEDSGAGEREGWRPALDIDCTIDWDADRREKLGRDLKDDIEQFLSDWSKRRANIKEWRRAATMMTPTLSSDDDAAGAEEGAGPWPGASNLRAPYTIMAVREHQRRLNSNILDPNPPVVAEARTQAAQAHIRTIEESLTARLEEAEYQQAVRQAHGALPVDGNCLVRTMWVMEQTRRPKIQVDVDKEVYRALKAAGMEDKQAALQAAKKDKRGRPKVFLAHETAVLRDGIEIKIIPYEQSFYLPSNAEKDADLYGIGEIVWARGSELLAGAEEGRYIKEAVERLFQMGGDDVAEDWRQDRLESVGGQVGGTENAARDRAKMQFKLYELDYLHDYDEDGYEEWGILTIHADSGLILRMQYLPYEHGRSRYTWFPYIEQLGELHGMSVAELLAVIQEAADVAISQFSDLVDVMVAAGGSVMFDDTSGLKYGEVLYKPGLGLKVNNVHGVQPLPIAQNIPGALGSLVNLLGLLKDWSEIVGHTSNPLLGRVTDTQKTLGEVQLVASQGAQIFGEIAAGVALRWGKIYDAVRWLVAQYAEDDQVSYRISAAPGEWEFKTVPAAVLRSEVDIHPAAAGNYPDRQVRVAIASMTHQALSQFPLVQMMMQQGDFSVLLDDLEAYLTDLGCTQTDKFLFSLRQFAELLAQQMAMQQQQAAEQQQQAAEQQRQAAEAVMAGTLAGLSGDEAGAGATPAGPEGAI